VCATVHERHGATLRKNQKILFAVCEAVHERYRAKLRKNQKTKQQKPYSPCGGLSTKGENSNGGSQSGVSPVRQAVERVGFRGDFFEYFLYGRQKVFEVRSNAP